MFQQKCFSKIGLSVALSLPVVVAESKPGKLKDEPKNLSRRLKPSQLPLYEDPEDNYSYEYHGKERTKLEEGISVVRKELETAYDATADARENVRNFLETGKAHSLATAYYVWEDENVAAKVGAITIGGMLGFLIGGRKRGFIKKLFYTSIGAAGMASMVYPKEAVQVCREVYANAGDYSLITYNFITGVKPQSEIKSASAAEPPKKAIPVAPAASSEVSIASRPNDTRFESLLQQSSDITLWGFRLFDRKEVSGRDATLKLTVGTEQAQDAVAITERQVPDLVKEPKHNRHSTEAGILGVKSERKGGGPPDASASTCQSTGKEAAFVVSQDTGTTWGASGQSDAQEDQSSAPDENQYVTSKVGLKSEKDRSSQAPLSFPSVQWKDLGIPQVRDVTHPSPGDGVGSKLVEMVKDVVEEVSSSIVAGVAEEVRKDASKISEEAKVIVDLGDKTTSVLRAAEEAAEATAKDSSPSVKDKVEAAVAVSKKLEDATLVAELAASGVESFADVVSGAAQTVEAAATKLEEREKEAVIKDVMEIAERVVEKQLEHSLPEDKKTPFLSFIKRFLHFFQPANERQSDLKSAEECPVSRDFSPIAVDISKSGVEASESGSKPTVSDTSSKSAMTNFSGVSIDQASSDCQSVFQPEKREKLSPAPQEAESESLATDVLEDIANTVIDSMLNLKIVAVKDSGTVTKKDERGEAESELAFPFSYSGSGSGEPILPDAFSQSQTSEHLSRSGENQSANEEALPPAHSKESRSSSPVENLADALIDSMLNIRIIPVNEDNSVPTVGEPIPPAENGKVAEAHSESVPQTGFKLISGSGLDSQSAHPSVDASIGGTPEKEGGPSPKGFFSLKEKLKKKFEAQKDEKNQEEEEKDIGQMDAKITPEVNATDSAKEISTPVVEDGLWVVEAPGHVPFMPDYFENSRKEDASVVPGKGASSKDVVVNVTPKPPSVPPVNGDIGQSNPEDKDMYTTRS